MKLNEVLILMLICLSLVLAYAFVEISYANRELDIQKKTLSEIKTALSTKEDKHKFELAASMGNLQRFSNKLFLAGKERNWELSHFYAHELEETIEDILHSNAVEEGQDVAKLMKEMLLPAFDSLEHSIEKENGVLFDTSFDLMTRSCNNCHASTKKNFIQITKPSQNTFNQSFKKQ